MAQAADLCWGASQPDAASFYLAAAAYSCQRGGAQPDAVKAAAVDSASAAVVPAVAAAAAFAAALSAAAEAEAGLQQCSPS